MKLTEKQVDGLIGIWHDDKFILCELWEFLGWSETDYSKWVRQPNFKPDSSLDKTELDFIFNKRRS